MICAAEDCDVEFERSPNKSFCSPRCRVRMAQRRYRADTGPRRAYQAERDALVNRVADRLAAAHDLEGLAALLSLGDYELDLLASMEQAA